MLSYYITRIIKHPVLSLFNFWCMDNYATKFMQIDRFRINLYCGSSIYELVIKSDVYRLVIKQPICKKDWDVISKVQGYTYTFCILEEKSNYTELMQIYNPRQK